MPETPAMPQLRQLALGCWVTGLFAHSWRNGMRGMFNVLVLGIVPTVAFSVAFYDALAPITGLFSKGMVENAKKQARQLEKKLQHTGAESAESLDWLNLLVKQIWPRIAKFAEQKIRNLEPTIQKKMPMGGSSVRFSKVTLGEEPLVFGPVSPRLVDAIYDGTVVKEDGVELNIGLSWHTDCNIVLSTPVATVGIADLSISGTLSIILRPFVDQSPFIGGLEVLFLDPPQIGLDFTGAGNIADMPGVSSAVRSAIDGAIAGILVAPRRKAYELSADTKVDLARLRNPRPEGMLRLTVVKAEKLEGTDFHVMSGMLSDPYCEVKLGGEKWRTPTVKKTCNPVWSKDNVHDFFVFSRAQTVSIDVFDEDYLKSDELGSIEPTPVSKLLELAGGKAAQFALGPKCPGAKPPPAGASVFIQCDWLNLAPLSAAPSASPASCGFILTFKVDECTGLPEGLGAPYTLRIRAEGVDGSRSSNPGYAKYGTVIEPATLQQIAKLKQNGVKAAVIAEVLGLDDSAVQEVFDDRRPAGGSDDAWIAELQAGIDERRASSNPQFEEVLRLPLQSKDGTAVVELMNSHKTPAVVAQFSVQIREDVIEGPFVFMAPGGGGILKGPEGQVRLLGSFELLRLQG